MCFFRECGAEMDSVRVAVGEIFSMTTPRGGKSKGAEEARTASEETVGRKRDALDRGLRRIYRDAAAEPIPARLAEVLRKLE